MSVLYEVLVMVILNVVFVVVLLFCIILCDIIFVFFLLYSVFNIGSFVFTTYSRTATSFVFVVNLLFVFKMWMCGGLYVLMIFWVYFSMLILYVFNCLFFVIKIFFRFRTSFSTARVYFFETTSFEFVRVCLDFFFIILYVFFGMM